jgi:Raf kinase inhibitor-like YbhB/YbcL family protein
MSCHPAFFIGDHKAMKIWSDSFKSGERIPVQYAFGKYSTESHITLSDNISPHIAWSGLAEGTQSLALICHDPDVPSQADDVNQEGKIVSADLPRVDFYHWVLFNLPANLSVIKEGEFSRAITPRGKSGPRAPHDALQGLNNYTQWFEGDKDMAGQYFGYDGPCPPWNDELLHHYHFTLYALDLDQCPVSHPVTGEGLLKVIQGHVLDKATLMATYAINPEAHIKKEGRPAGRPYRI